MIRSTGPRIRVFGMASLALLLAGCPCSVQFLPMTLTDDPDAPTPTKIVEGPYDFMGELFVTRLLLTDEWTLTGSFLFPTAGFEVGEAEIAVAESFPEQVTITIPVTPPPLGAFVAQVITEVEVFETIEVSDQATFEIQVRRECPPLF